MFIYKHDQLYAPKNIFIWFILAMQGGILNVGGYMAVHRFVSHVTGFATLFGAQMSKGEWWDAFGMLLGPLFYIMGTIFSAWFIERPRHRSKEPRYPIVFSVIIFNLLILAFAGYLGFLGNFGEEFHNLNDYLLLFVLALTCGIQNAVISSASGAVIRTTHLTGPTTDLGIGLVKWWTVRKNAPKDLVFANLCRMGIIASFITGSLIGAFTFSRLQFLGFLMPAFLTFFVMIRLNLHKDL